MLVKNWLNPAMESAPRMSAVTQQIQPLTPIGSQWISANAGSGKTYQLTRQVVRLLLLGVPPERICCITYTKAAAGEMRARVVNALRGLLLASDETCQKTVDELIGFSADTVIMQRARTLFGQVLDSHAGGVQLTTIHGFCQQVLRAFPLEAQVPPHFTVADDAQAAALRQQVKHRLLSNPGGMDDSVAASIALLAERSGEQRFDALLKTMLDKRAQWEAAWAGADAATYRTRLYAMAGVAEDASEGELLHAAMHGFTASQLAALRAALPELQREKPQYLKDFAARVEQWLATPPEQWATLQELWLDCWLTKSARTPISNLGKYAARQNSALDDAIQHGMALAERFVAAQASLALAEESFAAALLARQVLGLYAMAKAERSVLDYEDLIIATRRLLTLDGSVGWVMSKLDHRIDHLLIDEAQDTSSEQWRIAHALVEELVASTQGVGAGGVPRSLFVVGDEKQSIYSFQGAAPDIYVRKHSEMQALLAPTQSPLVTRPLNDSYRSANAILKVVDAVAALPHVSPALSDAGAPQPHGLKKTELIGSVALHPLIEPEEKAERTAFEFPLEYRITRSPAQLLAEHVTAHVRAMLDSGEWRAGDILILTRSRHPIVLPLLRCLQRAGVPVAGMDRLVLSQHLAVRDLLALMRWCAHRNDDLALAQLLRSPLVDWSGAQLEALAAPRGPVSLWHALEQADAVLAERLRGWAALLDQGPYAFLTRVLEVDRARQRYALRFGAEIHEILDELKEQAMQMPATLAPTVANFCAWIGGSDRQIKREMDAGAHDHVRVMTVHGSKGLESRAVLLVDSTSVPDLKREIFSMAEQEEGWRCPLLALSDEAKQAVLWDSARETQKAAQLREYQRLLYVALTRPAEALHVFGMAPGRGELSPQCWYETVRAGLQGMPGHRVLEDGSVVYEDAGTRPPAAAANMADMPEVPTWARAAIAPVARASVLSPSNLAAAPAALAPFAVARGESARERGVRLHRVLQFLQPGMSDAQVSDLIRYLSPDWNATQQQRAVDEVLALYHREPWLFTAGGEAEVTIAGPVTILGQRYDVLGRIDLLLDTGEAIVVLDYKTGRDVPASASAVGDAYLLQLKLYVALLETLYPGRVIRPAIVWTANAQLMWLDAAVAATSWDRAQLPIRP
ncbi:MAG: hypothetical protein DI582_01110 [Azospirillum brasilense]|nr:MAG: hypothetical protein DI582_01110 [Azospirillum brasilense]